MNFKNNRIKKKPLQILKDYSTDFFERIKGIDRITLILVAILFGIGLIMVYSITSISIYNGVKGDPSNLFIKTLIMGIAGIIAMLCVIAIPYRTLKNLSILAAIFCPLILVVTFLFAGGSENSDVKSWFQIGSFKLQPAEFVKIGMIMAVAWLVDYRVRKGTYYLKTCKGINWSITWQSFIFVICYIGLCTGLVLIQPDFGSALIIGFIGLIMFLSTGVKWKAFKPIFYFGVCLLVIGFIIMSKVFPYQLERFAVWKDPFNHAKGFQNVMGYTAIALGGMTGVGVGNSTQKYGYVLEPHNDMISTILAEELGVWMILVVMVIYFFIAMRCFFTAIKCKELYGSIASIGIGAIFLVQPLINLGGASGAFPLTGVTLPFISYGGSSLVSLFIGIGIYLNISMERAAKEKKLKEKKQHDLKMKVVPFPKA